MKSEAIENINSTTNELVSVISSFEQESLNSVPFEGSWTAAQVADHVLKSYGGVWEILNNKAIPCERKPDEKVQAVKDLFLDFSIRMTSPDFVLPTNLSLEKETLIQNLNQLRTNLINQIELVDLTNIFIEFELPGFGPFTGLEWVHFLIYHMQRTFGK